MLVIPILFISMNVFMFSSGSDSIQIGYIDLDDTKLSNNIINYLNESHNLLSIDIDEVNSLILSGDIVYAVKIPIGYSEDFISGNNPQIIGYESMDDNLYRNFHMALEDYINTLNVLAINSNRDEDKFYERLEYYSNNRVFEVESISGSADNLVIGSSVGFLIMGILFFSVRSLVLIMKDKKSNILDRLMTTPLTMKSYVFENLLSFILVSIIQILGILMMLSYVYRLDLSGYFFKLFIVLFLFSVNSIALSMTFIGFSNDINKINTISTLLLTPMLMIGGAFWPREIMPDILIKVGYIIPVTWAMEASQKIVVGMGLRDIILEILILNIFTLIFLSVTIIKRKKLA